MFIVASLMPAIKHCVDLIYTPDADGARFAGGTRSVADVDIVTPSGKILARARADGCVGAAAGKARQRLKADGRVDVAVDVARQRISTDGRCSPTPTAFITAIVIDCDGCGGSRSISRTPDTGLHSLAIWPVMLCSRLTLSFCCSRES